MMVASHGIPGPRPYPDRSKSPRMLRLESSLFEGFRILVRPNPLTLLVVNNVCSLLHVLHARYQLSAADGQGQLQPPQDVQSRPVRDGGPNDREQPPVCQLRPGCCFQRQQC